MINKSINFSILNLLITNKIKKNKKARRISQSFFQSSSEMTNNVIKIVMAINMDSNELVNFFMNYF
ncbi:MAG: hypothetical protein ABIE43_04460 [Patescibacteria group bacterium]